MAFFYVGHLFRRAGGYDLSPGKAAFRTDIDDMIGTLNNIQVMFNDNDRMPAVGELIERVEEFGDIFEMKAGRWFVKEIEGMIARRLAQEFG